MALYHQQLFKKKKQLLNGNIQIIACAGSGKTEFVSERIATQINEGIAKPDQIVAFTFTEKAAEELKFRTRSKIKELMGRQPDIGDMYIGTIHAFAFKLLQEFIPRYRAFDMLDEVSRLAFIASIRRDIDLDYLTNSLSNRFKKPWGRNNQNWVIRTFIRDVDFFREDNLKPEQAVSDSFRKAYEVYLNKLEEKRFLDFSGILRIAVDTLKANKKILAKVQAQYSFFTVDEYQDVNPIQEELIQILSGKQNVCVVGDDDQSIYQWRGADLRNIMTFTKRYKNVVVHELNENRRSTDKIIATGNDLIIRNSERLLKSIQPNKNKTEKGDMYKVVFDTQDEEIEWMVKKIRALVGKEFDDNGTKRKLKYSDVALLFRSISIEGSNYIEALEHEGIPVIYSGVGGLFETEEVDAVMRIFAFISECDKDVVYDDEFLQTVHRIVETRFNVAYSTFSKRVIGIREWAKGQKRMSLQKMYGLILSMVGLSEDSFHDNEDEVLLYNLGRLSQAISDYEDAREYLTFNSIKDFIWFIRLHAENSYDSGNTNAMAGLIDAVQVMTMHGTKGLGFPVVFMPCHLRQNRTPDFGATFIDTDKVDVQRFLSKPEDDRRLYYVAITRAKKFLFITSANIKIGGKRASPRSNMFDEIPEKHFITTQIPDPTKRKSCKLNGVSDEIRFPTSYSELAYYLNCGYDYKMRFIYGFNPGLVPALGFGKQVHNVINLLHKEYEDTGVIPNRKKVKQYIDEHFYLRYASDSVTENLKIGALKSLEKYVKMWEKDFSLAIKTERPFELEFENSLIAGSIDMIKRESEEGTVLEVIDFKTGKPDNDLMHRYELQVQLYTIAAQEALNINTEKALIHFIDTDKNQRLSVDTSKAALGNAREELSYAITGITQNNFGRDARQNKICQECDWCNICPKRKGFRA